MDDEFREQIFSIADSLRDARLAYQILWELQNVENLEEFRRPMNRYKAFFQTVIHDALVTVTITIYRLFETKKNLVTIPNLRITIEQNVDIDDSTRLQIRELADKIQVIWSKFARIRSSIIAHRHKNDTPEKAFAEADIKHDEIRDVISYMQELLNILSVKAIKESHAFNSDAAPDIQSLMHNLQMSVISHEGKNIYK